jgi:hypothetical protein
MKLTPKQEAFAQAVVTGLTQSDAYRAAYKVRPGTKAVSINVAASKLMADPNISIRVSKLRETVAKKSQMTLETHLNDLLSLREMAAKGKQYSAAITAEVARGKASGIHVERSENTGAIEHIFRWQGE